MKTEEKILAGTDFLFTAVGDRFALCGQPGPEELQAFQKEGWTDVLNLRGKEEMQHIGWDPIETCQNLNLSYSQIPVIQQKAFLRSALEKLHEKLKSLEAKGDKKIVIHCASGFRSSVTLVVHFIMADLPKDTIALVAKGLKISHIDRLFEQFEKKN